MTVSRTRLQQRISFRCDSLRDHCTHPLRLNPRPVEWQAMRLMINDEVSLFLSTEGSTNEVNAFITALRIVMASPPDESSLWRGRTNALHAPRFFRFGGCLAFFEYHYSGEEKADLIWVRQCKRKKADHKPMKTRRSTPRIRIAAALKARVTGSLPAPLAARLAKADAQHVISPEEVRLCHEAAKEVESRIVKKQAGTVEYKCLEDLKKAISKKR